MTRRRSSRRSRPRPRICRRTRASTNAVRPIVKIVAEQTRAWIASQWPVELRGCADRLSLARDLRRPGLQNGTRDAAPRPHCRQGGTEGAYCGLHRRDRPPARHAYPQIRDRRGCVAGLGIWESLYRRAVMALASLHPSGHVLRSPRFGTSPAGSAPHEGKCIRRLPVPGWNRPPPRDGAVSRHDTNLHETSVLGPG